MRRIGQVMGMGGGMDKSKGKGSTSPPTSSQVAKRGCSERGKNVVTLARADLLAVLTKLRPGLAKTEIVEQAFHFIFTGDRAVTFNDQISVSVPFATPFRCSVRSQEFYKVLDRMSSENVTLSFEEGKGLGVGGGRTRSFFSSVMADGDVMERVAGLAVDESDAWSAVPEDLVDGMELCMFSVSRDQTRDWMTCVVIDGEAGRIFSTDDLRISEYTLSGPMDGMILLPLHSVIPLVADHRSISKYVKSAGWIHFASEGGVVFSSRVMDEEPDDIGGYFAVEDPVDIKWPEGVKAIIDRVEVFASGEIDVDRRVTISLESGKMTLRGEIQGMGWIEEDAEVEYDGEGISFEINPLFLKQVLGTTDQVTVGKDRCLFQTEKFRHVMVLPMGEWQ